MVIFCTVLLVSDPKATNWLAKERDKRERKAQLKARHEALKTLKDMAQVCLLAWIRTPVTHEVSDRLIRASRRSS